MNEASVRPRAPNNAARPGDERLRPKRISSTDEGTKASCWTEEAPERLITWEQTCHTDSFLSSKTGCFVAGQFRARARTAWLNPVPAQGSKLLYPPAGDLQDKISSKVFSTKRAKVVIKRPVSQPLKVCPRA